MDTLKSIETLQFFIINLNAQAFSHKLQARLFGSLGYAKLETKHEAHAAEAEESVNVDKFVMAYIGSHSDRDEGKIGATGLEVEFSENDTPIFPQARLVIECRKIYAHDLDRNKFSDSLIGNYAQKKFQGVVPHTVYFGEILNWWEVSG